MAREKRRSFTPEFKLEAVRRAKERKQPLSQIARDLGLHPNLLREWVRKAEAHGDVPAADIFPGNGKLSTDEEEIRRLKRELEVVRQERDFLKKAAAYFAKESR
jgi:transposase